MPAARPTAPSKALIRPVPASYGPAYAPPDAPDFIDDARRQHAGYVAALESAGVVLERLETDENHPDAHFVEDTAVVVGETALICHLGREDRRGEELAAAERLGALGYTIRRMEPPATLEGGDVLHVGGRFYVGRSLRTNDAGIAALGEVCRRHGFPLVVVPVPAGCLHLKTNCSGFSPDGVLVATSLMPASVFDGAGLEIVEIVPEEAYAANCLALGERVLLPSGHLKTAAALEERGFDVTLLPMSTFRQSEGALTCLSILLG